MGCIVLVRCVLVLRCGLAVVVWYPYASFSLHTDTTSHIEPEQCNPWNNSTNKSHAPEDGCINIRNMLSIKQWNNKTSDLKLVSLYSTIKMMHGPINIRFTVTLCRISTPYRLQWTKTSHMIRKTHYCVHTSWNTGRGYCKCKRKERHYFNWFNVNNRSKANFKIYTLLRLL